LVLNKNSSNQVCCLRIPFYLAIAATGAPPTSVKYLITLLALNVKTAFLGSIDKHNCYKTSFFPGMKSLEQQHSKTIIVLSFK